MLIRSKPRGQLWIARSTRRTASPHYLDAALTKLQYDLDQLTTSHSMGAEKQEAFRRARLRVDRVRVSTPSPPEHSDQQESRILDVDMNGGPLVTGTELFLTAAVLLRGSKTFGKWAATIGFDPKAGPVMFHVTASGFDLLSNNKISLVVPVDSDSKRVVFSLRVTEAHVHWICLTLFQEGDQIGQITINDFSALDKAKGQNQQDSVGIFFHSDLTLIARSNSSIIEAWSEPKNLNGVSLKEFKAPDQRQRVMVRDAIAMLYDPSADPKEQERELKIVGAELRKCLPDDLTTLLTSGEVKTLCLQHDKGVDFPFELCWFDESGGGFFLGDRIAVCRWFMGTHRVPKPRKTPVSNVAVLLGRSAASKRAAQMLKGVLPEFRTFKTKKDVVENILKKKDFDILHFIGHCIRDKKGASLELAQGKIEMMSIGQLKEETVFGERKPFVTLNGCSTTASYVSLFEEDSFAYRFVEAQACGFLGTLWSVDGRVANAFSRLFYRGLVSGLNVREALMKAKAKLLGEVKRDGESGKPNPVAVHVAARSYCIFANPDLRLQFTRGRGSLQGLEHGGVPG